MLGGSGSPKGRKPHVFVPEPVAQEPLSNIYGSVEVGVVLQPTRRAFEEALRDPSSFVSAAVARSAGVRLAGVHHGDPLPESLVLDVP